MKKKRIRFGILWVDGKFIELFSMRPHGDGWIMWTPGSVKHVTTIKEPDAISSHRTKQDTSKQTPLGRLFYEDVDFDEELAKLTNLRKLEESKYDQILLYQNREFWDTLLTTEFELVTEDRKRDILRYIDLSKVFGDIVKRVERLQADEIMPFLTCKASDLLVRKDIEAGISMKELAVFEFEGELYEFDIKPFTKFGSKDHPWANILKPFGFFELLEDIDWEERLKDT